MARRRERNEEMGEERQDVMVSLSLMALAGIFFIAISMARAMGKLPLGGILVGLGMLAATAISALLLRRRGII